MIKNIIFSLLILVGLQFAAGCAGCSENQKSKKTDALTLPDSLITDAPLKLSEEIMGEVIGNISSPVEMAGLCKSNTRGFKEIGRASCRERV